MQGLGATIEQNGTFANFSCRKNFMFFSKWQYMAVYGDYDICAMDETWRFSQCVPFRWWLVHECFTWVWMIELWRSTRGSGYSRIHVILASPSSIQRTPLELALFSPQSPFEGVPGSWSFGILPALVCVCEKRHIWSIVHLSSCNNFFLIRQCVF